MSRIAINDLKLVSSESFIEEFDNDIPEILGGASVTLGTVTTTTTTTNPDGSTTTTTIVQKGVVVQK